MSDTVLYSVADGIATLTLNRPQVLNALDEGMIRALRSACERVEREEAARVAVLRGAGPAFLAGGDVSAFHANLPRAGEMLSGLARELHHGIRALRRAAKPVIATVHGAVAGAGMSLMMAADIVIAAAGTRFTMAYSRIGASPDGGASFFLPRLVGYQRAMELLLLADACDADTLARYGIVNRVVPEAELEGATLELARRLADGPARAYGETKALVNRALEHGLAEQLDAEAAAFARCAGTRDFAEGVTAFVAKRKPNFRGE